jgi:glycosyltransferase involved in cell wall biosynthesis
LAVHRPIRVCLPILFYPPEFSGHGIQIERCRPYLEAQGVETTVLTQRLDPSLPAELAPHVKRRLTPGFGPLPTLRRARELRQFFRERPGRFDVVHSVLLGWEFLLNLRFLRAGHRVLYEMVLLDGDDPLAVARSRGGPVKLKLLRQVDAWSALSRAFVPPYEAAGFPRDRLHVVHGGVDTERHRPRRGDERRELRARLGIPSEVQLAVTGFALVKRKGIDRVLESWARLRPVRDRQLLLVIGPDQPEDRAEPEFVAAVEQRIRAEDLAGTVRLTGRVDNLDEYLGVADLFVFLSRKEGLGYVMLEGMSSELPCIVSPLDGIADEVLEDGRTGFVAREPDDPDDVAATMRKVLDDPGLARAVGEAARRSVLERFSMEVRARRLGEIYRSLGPEADPSGG